MSDILSFESTSSNIHHVSYNQVTNTLTVRFRSGGEYEYYEVEPTIFDRMEAAEASGESCSRIFVAEVRNSDYLYQKVN